MNFFSKKDTDGNIHSDGTDRGNKNFPLRQIIGLVLLISLGIGVFGIPSKSKHKQEAVITAPEQVVAQEQETQGELAVPETVMERAEVQEIQTPPSPSLDINVPPIQKLSMAEAHMKAVEAFNKNDHETALKLWLPMAETIVTSDTQYKLGLIYNYGWGTPRNYSEAVKWYLKAADQGFASVTAEAKYKLGLIYSTGQEGVPQDLVQAYMYLNLSTAGNKKVAKELAALAEKMTPEQITEAKRLSDSWQPVQMRKNAVVAVNDTKVETSPPLASDQDETMAKNRMAEQLANSAIKMTLESIAKSTPVAELPVPDAPKAATPETATAEELLAEGKAYYRGEGVKKNPAEAINRFRRAAELGNSTAQLYLGIAYRSGDGVKKDKKEALNWLRLAAKQQVPQAQIALGKAYYTGDSIDMDRREAIQWFRAAAEQGHSTAQLYLGVAYYLGEGIEKDDGQAARWLRASAAQGDKDAVAALRKYNLSK